MIKLSALGYNSEKLIQQGGNFLFSLLIFAIVFDPTNTILHLKDVFFVLLVMYNIAFFKPNLTYLVHICVIFAVVFTCYVFAEMQQNLLTFEDLFAVFKSFAPLILLFWIHRYNVIKLSLVPVFVVSLFLLVLYILSVSYPEIEYAIWILSMQYDEVIRMSHREIMGFPVFAMYYKSVACFIFTLAYCAYAATIAKTKGTLVGYLFICLIVGFAFWASGSRATMLLPFFILVVVLYPRIRDIGRMKYFLYPCIALLFLMFVMVILVLAMEKEEASNAIKYTHLVSYMNLFEDHPLYMLIGQGPATGFYSEGFGRVTTVTEWSYMELFRNYGLFCVLLLAVIMEPLYTMYRYRKWGQTFVIMAAYVAYLLIAGTNPLLLSSTGMLMILSAYSYKHQLLQKEPEPGETPEP